MGEKEKLRYRTEHSLLENGKDVREFKRRTML